MIISGVIKALGNSGWQQEFNLGPHGLPLSFIAVALYLPLCFVIAAAAIKHQTVSGHIPYGLITFLLSLIVLVFPVVAFILCRAFGKQEFFRAWVIVRNWAMLFVFLLMALVFGLYLVEFFPFEIAFFLGISAYLGTLAIDIRLAMRIAEFDWTGAVFTGVLINLSSMMLLYFGILQTL